MADIVSRLPTQDQSDGATGSAAPTEAILVGGTDGTNLRALSVTNTGILNVQQPIQTITGTLTSLSSVVNGTLLNTGSINVDVSGSGFVGTITVVENTPSSARVLGVFNLNTSAIAANITVNGNYRVVGAPIGPTISVQFSAYTSGSATINIYCAATPYIVQPYSANAANVLVTAYTVDGSGNAIGSVGTSLDVVQPDSSSTGTLGALNATVNLPINDKSSAYALISGTWVGTIQFQGSVDGSTFVPLEAVQGGPTNAYTTAGFTSNGGVRIAIAAGFVAIQAKMIAYTSGTATVIINTSAGISNVETLQFNAANLKTTAYTVDGSGNSINSQSNALNVNTKTNLIYSAPTTASVGTTSSLILAANASRLGLYLSNTSTQQISLGFGGNAAVYQNGITLFPGEKFYMDEYSFNTGAVYAVTTGAATYIGVQEIT